ncbi:MAG: ribosome-binding factor A [Halobacteriovoraceae bacterium]|nr:ribosome-binding factor A [Peredibacter sp.]MBJ00770.1 ribosome-binding factor A [Halobacteriovoraceae bacterium]|tara:strand:+ start:2663 stop:3019 length:357 start_codon:yes stop_codon:yes gene_type:complete
MARKGGSHNKAMFEERIKNEMNSFLRTELKDPRLMLMSITRVELNQDYSVASVYWDTFDSSKRGDIKAALNGTKGRLRSLLAKNLKVRHTPELNFSYDSQFEDERKIESLLKDNPTGE